MARDKFDKKLADRMFSQEMQPDDAIWNRVEATLDTAAPILLPTTKRRNGLTFATVSSVAAALLLSFLLLNRDEQPVEQIVSAPLVEKHDDEVMAPKMDLVEKIEPLVAQVASVQRASRRVAEQPIERVRVSVEAPEEKNETVKSADETPRPTRKTRSVAVAENHNTNEQQSGVVNHTEPRRKKNHLAISVSGSGNFSSSSTITGNNSIVRPMKTINGTNVISLYSSKDSNRKWKHNMPLAFSVTVQKMFTNKIGIETGLTYTYLSSTSKGESILDQDIKQQLNYLGIPLSVFYSIVEGRKFELYAKGGFLVDKAIAAKGTSKLDDKSQSIDINTKGVQFSALLQVGASYNLTNYMSLYLEPTGNYYFRSKEPISYRTENDFGFTAMVGLRFKLQ